MDGDEKSSTSEKFKTEENESTTRKSRLMEKFQALKDRRKEIARQGKPHEKSSPNSHLKLKAHAKADDKDQTEKELDARHQHTAASSTSKKRKNSEDNAAKTVLKKSNADTSEVQSNHSGNTEWKDVQMYLDVNKHLQGVDKGKYAPKTKLEEDIDKAIAAGDYEKAEKLSDHLSQRHIGEKIANAFDAKRYDEKKKNEYEMAKVKRQKKLHWGFDHKERWEMKGNM